MKNSLYGIRFRSERFFHVLGEGWFFEAREGMFGPYGTRPRAQEALSNLIARFPQKRPEKPLTRISHQGPEFWGKLAKQVARSPAEP